MLTNLYTNQATGKHPRSFFPASYCFCLLFTLIIGTHSLKASHPVYKIVKDKNYQLISGTGTSVALSEFQVSDSLPIGFNFGFFNKSYSYFRISSKGFITFANNTDPGCCPNQYIPDGTTPNNLIAFAWGSLNPENGGSISYFTTGSSPNQRLVIDFNEVPLSYVNGKVSMQLILHETTNLIEIQAYNIPFETNHSMGIENEDGSASFVVENRNSSAWSCKQERVLFIPQSFGSANDIGIFSIQTDALRSCPGTYPVTATLRNFGTTVVEDADIHWSVNGVEQSAVHYTGVLDSLDGGESSEATINLGDYNFSSNQAYTLKAWSSSPDGASDPSSLNDTSTFIFRPALSGTFTIGGSGSDFLNFTSAAEAISQYGVCGPVNFSVRDGIYLEQIQLKDISGTSSTNTITFQSASGTNTSVTLSYSSTDQSNNYTIQISNADFISFKNMTLKATGSMYARVLDIRNNSDNCHFTGNIFEGISSTDEYYASLVYLNDEDRTDSNNNDNVFSQNTFNYGAVAINIQQSQGSGGEAKGRASSLGTVGTIITSNTFNHQNTKAIYAQRLDGGDFIANTITSDSTNDYSQAIRIENAYNLLRIQKNKLAVKSGEGISLYSTNSNDGTSFPLISNNFISIGSGKSRAIGLLAEYCYYTKIINNSISNNSTDSTNSYAASIYYCSYSTFHNNAVIHKERGYAINAYGAYQSSFDYNDYFTHGVKLGYWNGNANNLGQLKSLSGQESHSISFNPDFISNKDLHTNSSALNGKGKGHVEVPDDIDGELRSALPDIGADEFFGDSLDAALLQVNSPVMPFAMGARQVKVLLANNGTKLLSSADINWKVNGVSQSTVHWTGSLAAGDTSSIVLGNQFFSIGTKYDILAWVNSPNGATDQATANDTIRVDSLYASLAGTYTIGGTSPDFMNFTDAVTALKIGGVIGAVTFNVRNGIYTEQIEIPAVKGVSALNSIQFKSESGDSTAVTLRFAAGSTNNYVVQLNGASYISFKKLTIEATGTNYSKVISLISGSRYNAFISCILKNPVISSSSADQSVIWSYSTYTKYNHGNQYISNSVKGGSQGIYCYGYSSASYYADTGLVIKNNQFSDQYYMGISINNQYEAKLTGNTVSTSQNNSNYYGIYITNCNSRLKILKNKISLPNGGYGLYTYNCNGYSGAENIIANNFISVGGTGNAYGIYSYYGAYTHLYHNSVHINSSNINTYALYHYSTSNQKIKNNIFSCSGGGYALYYGNTNVNGVTIDYNNYFTNGTRLANWNGDRANLALWQTASGFDAHSFSINPSFPSFTNLHLNKASLNNLGTPLSEVIEDIDGDPRLTPPDIGADEFTIVGENLALYAIVPPKAPFKGGIMQPVYARIRNTGQSTVTSFNINWTVNGSAQTAVNWTGNLPAGGTDSILLGNYTFALHSNHAIKAWSGNPNATTDISPDDDTSSVTNVYAGLEGTYSIGSSGSDFSNFSTAVTQLNFGGVLNAVTFTVKPGNYYEQITIKQFPGASCAVPVVFTSLNNDSTSVVLNYSADNISNFTLRLDGADGISFRKMTIRASHAYYARAIELTNGANCNSFLHNVIAGSTNTSNYGDIMAVVFSGSSTDNKNTFDNNLITNGSYGIYLTSGSNPKEKSNIITSNKFEHQLTYGVMIQYQDSSKIIANTFNRVSNTSSTAIYVNYYGIKNEISKNRIVSTNGGIGIQLDNCSGQLNKENIISNNFISLGSSISNSRGITIQSCSYLYIVNNSVNITGSGSTAAAFYTSYCSETTVNSNIFHNASGGYAYTNYSSQYRFFSNRNNLYTTGSKIGSYNSADKTNLSNWKQSTGLDSNSVSVDSRFVSFNDLHTKQINLNGNARVFSFVSTDIDGEPRDATRPDIGADEFVPLQTDAGIFSYIGPKAPFTQGNNNVFVTLKNYGSDTLKNVNIDWTVNGDQQVRVNWTGALAGGDTVVVQLGNYLFNAGTIYNLKTWTNQPNTAPDLLAANDTIKVNNLYCALNGTYTIGGTNPDFINFSAANTALKLGGVAGNVTFKVRNGIYAEQISIPEIVGTSASSVIVFESESGDSSLVSLQFNSVSYDNNFTLQLNGADFINFRKMTLASLNDAYGRVIDIKNGSNYAKINNCVIKGRNSNNYDYNSVIYSSGSADSYTSILNNRILNGTYGISFYGASSPSWKKGCTISRNLFENQLTSAIYFYYQDSITVHNNTITTNASASTSFFGIYCQNSGRLTISKNKMAISNGGYGLYMYYCNNSTPGNVTNNFIQLGGGTGFAYGLYLYYCNYQNIYYNSVHISGSSAANGRALSLGYNNYNCNIKNNIFANSAGGYALYNDYNSSNNVSDYNDIYSNGPKYAYWGAEKANLSELKSASNAESHSISQNPLFVSTTNLHAREVTLNKAATPIATVTDDIDGELRDNTQPDIGADEFQVAAPEDAGIVAIAYPHIPFSAGVNPVYVKLRNYGSDTLKSATISWKVNNVAQAAYSWLGSVAPGGTDSVSIGTYNFLTVPVYTIRAWSESPNGKSDTLHYNDTSQVSNLYTALNGVYTIGGISPDFNTFTAAAQRLSLGGVSGPVTFNVRNGTYKEQLLLGAITGASAVNTILFQAENGDSSRVILKDSLTTTVVELNGSDYITLKQLSIRNSHAYYGNVIALKNGATFNNIHNCAIQGVNTQYYYSSAAAIYAQGANSNNQYKNNLILKGSYGLLLNGEYNNHQTGTVIENNQITHPGYAGVSIQYQNGAKIRKNTIQLNSTNGTLYGCQLSSCNGALEILKNKIYMLNDGYGLAIDNAYCTISNPALIANNFIAAGGTVNASGISLTSSSYINIYHNNIHIKNTSTAVSAIYLYNCSNTQLRNNIAANTGSGMAISINSSGSNLSSDYNDLFSKGTVLAQWNNTNIADLNNWKTQSNLDQHSLTVDPLYNAVNDLHVAQTALNGAAISLPVITDDIDGDNRNITTPDIGADEFETNKNDLGITEILPASGCVLGSNESIIVTVRNFGSNAQSNFTVSYQLDNAAVITENVTQSIAAGASLKYTFSAKANLSALRNYKLLSYTSLNNDEKSANDTTLSNITNMARLDIRVTADTTICPGNYLWLQATGADNYLWNTGAKTSYLNVHPTVATTYIVTGTNQFNCSDSDTIKVKVHPAPLAPVINPAGPITFCNGGSKILTANLSQHITWSTGEKTASITVHNSGSYTVTFTDTTGCTATSASVQVTEEKAPGISPQNLSICSNDSVLITVKDAVSYSWSTGSLSSSIKVKPLSTSTYSVNVITALGCSSTLSSTITLLPTQTPDQVSGLSPANGAVDLSLPLDVSWLPADKATQYDIFVWPADQPKPATPKVVNLNAIRYRFDSGDLNYGITYKWQVISKFHSCESTPGPVLTFMLRHLPDVVITNVQIPNTAFTGQNIDITWEVKNKGLGNTVHQQWTDELSMAIDTIWDGFHILGNVANMTYLEPGQSYSKKASFTLPKFKDGLFNIVSWADRYNALLEKDNTNNTGKSAFPLWVKLTPPPDLFVNTIVPPADVFSEDTVNITWSVINKGKWPTETNAWTDRVYISQDYDTAKRYFLGNFYHKGDTLYPNQSYTTTHAVILPQGIFGRYYFYVETDINNQVQEHAYDGNNISQSDSVNVILRPPADLMVSNIVTPATATNIETINIKWKVSNVGNSSPNDKHWSDAVYLTKSRNYDLSNAYVFSFNRSKPTTGVPLGLVYNSSEQIKIPNMIPPGDYYAYVKTDNALQVFEYTFEANNILRSDTTIKISVAPWPDLTVTSLQYPDSIGAGENMRIKYTVTNQGTASAVGTWEDKIYISTDNSNCPWGVEVKSIKRNTTIPVNGSYTVDTTVVVPYGFKYGSAKYCYSIITDAANTLYEHTSETNNDTTRKIFIKPSDLTVSSYNIPAQAYSGSNIPISWLISNIGTAATPAPYWRDKIEVLDSNQVSLTAASDNLYWKYAPVKAGANYTNQNSLFIPEGLQGNCFIRLTTDLFNNNNEKITTNNVTLVPIKIILRKPTDLYFSSFNPPANAIAGQPIEIPWQVKNKGQGSTVAHAWADRIYLSQDTIIDPYNDILLGSYTRNGDLNAGDAYSKNEQLFIPINAVGNYYVLGYTDFASVYEPYGKEYEHQAENNNIAKSLISISLSPPSDLVVTNISAPANATAGEPYTVSWTIRNNGPNKAYGYLTDMVYFSKDQQWDINDPFFGEKPVLINLSPNRDTTFTLTTELTGTGVGDYHVVIRTDNKNNINESSDQNNTLASVNTVKVEVAELPLYVLKSKQLFNSKGIYYRIEIPDSLNDETLLITLKGDSVLGANELYISHDSVPDRSKYEYASGKPFSGNQEVIVPNLKKGRYYLLVYGNKSVGDNQPITLYAEIIHFQIRSVEANEGGSGGPITVQLNGAKFTNNMDLYLKGNGTSIQANALLYVDPTKVFATFNLSNAPLGLYDVVAIKSNGDTATLKNGFKITTKSPFGLVTSVKAPVRMRRGTIDIISVQFANDGNVDLPIPQFKLISEDGLPISFLRQNLDDNNLELSFQFREVNGPQTVLRPGAIGTVYIWVSATATGLCHFRFE